MKWAKGYIWQPTDLWRSIAPKSIPTLEVVVQSSSNKAIPGQDRPQRAPWQIHESITRAKVGGIKEEEPTPQEMSYDHRIGNICFVLYVVHICDEMVFYMSSLKFVRG